jgi:hypothetical protein
MVQPSSLRIGNLLTVCYEEGLKPYSVEVLQADLVHLSNRAEAEDPRDLIGLRVTPGLLLSENFTEQDDVFTVLANEKMIKVCFNKDKETAALYVANIGFEIKYIHELQNILFYFAGWEITESLENSIYLH